MSIRFVSNSADIIDEIRGVIGRPVTFYLKYKDVCPTCGIDPISGDALDSWCPTCSGVGYILTWSGTEVLGHILQGKVENQQWATGGLYFDGDATLQVKYTDLNISLADNSDYLIADGIKFFISNRIYRGVPEINRIILVLKERADNDE